MDRIVAEHQQFSHGLKELQDWMTDAIQMLESYCHPTADKGVLDSRMAKLEVGKEDTRQVYFGCLIRKVLTLEISFDSNAKEFKTCTMKIRFSTYFNS